MPDQHRDIAAATDGDLWARRDAYARDTAWAPPYVADDLRAAHLAEDACRADAVHAWHQADATTDPAARTQALRQAEENSALAQEVGTYRETLTEIAGTRRRWHTATETTRQQALLADAELRRRYSDIDLLPLHPAEESAHAEGEAMTVRDEATTSQPEQESQPDQDQPRRDITAALDAARQAEHILSVRSQAGRDSDELMHRREAEAQREAEARRNAVRQDPAPNRHQTWLELEEPELETGQ
jgi:hypothetical protein